MNELIMIVQGLWVVKRTFAVREKTWVDRNGVTGGRGKLRQV